VGAEANFVIVHGKVGHASAELEQQFARITILLVLPDTLH
jgi:hypothetical protein